MTVPAGRAGRAWLRHRIALAERASDHLTVRLRLLLDAQRRNEELLAALTTRFADEVTAAGARLLQAEVTGGQRALRLGAATTPGRVTVDHTTLMGLHLPVDAHWVPPERGRATVDTVPAVVPAREAHRLALTTAVRYAAAGTARELLGREIATTRRRLRALDRRSLPRLRNTLHDLDLTLEEHEHAEAFARHAHQRR